MTAILPLKGMRQILGERGRRPSHCRVRKLQCIGYLTVKTGIGSNAAHFKNIRQMAA